jgi:hypothetical protein
MLLHIWFSPGDFVENSLNFIRRPRGINHSNNAGALYRQLPPVLYVPLIGQPVERSKHMGRFMLVHLDARVVLCVPRCQTHRHLREHVGFNTVKGGRISGNELHVIVRVPSLFWVSPRIMLRSRCKLSHALSLTIGSQQVTHGAIGHQLSMQQSEWIRRDQIHSEFGQ